MTSTSEPSMTEGLVAPDCPLCGSSSRHRVHAGAADVYLGHAGRFDIVECDECAARYIDPRPVGDTLAAYYGDTDQRAYPNHLVGVDLELPPAGVRELLVAERGYPAQSDAAPAVDPSGSARAWLDDDIRTHRILPWEGEGKLLDVGCGSGSYLATMQALGWNVTGVDLFADLAEQVSETLGVPCHAGALPDVGLQPGSFDVITFWHVVEHLPDPGTVLRHAVSLLRPGGVLAVGVPVYDCREEQMFGGSWLGYDVPRHLFTFSRARLASFLEEQGLVVEGMKSESAGWVIRQGLKTTPTGFVRRQLLGHKRVRNWYAQRLADGDRSGKAVALARKP